MRPSYWSYPSYPSYNTSTELIWVAGNARVEVFLTQSRETSAACAGKI